MTCMKMVGNRVSLYMGLTREDGTQAVLGVDMKPGPDYAFLEVPVKLPARPKGASTGKLLLKAGEPITLTTGLHSTPHRAHVLVMVNPALMLAGTVKLSCWMIEAGDPAEIVVPFVPDTTVDLTSIKYLVRLYCLE